MWSSCRYTFLTDFRQTTKQNKVKQTDKETLFDNDDRSYDHNSNSKGNSNNNSDNNNYKYYNYYFFLILLFQ